MYSFGLKEPRILSFAFVNMILPRVKNRAETVTTFSESIFQNEEASNKCCFEKPKFRKRGNTSRLKNLFVELGNGKLMLLSERTRQFNLVFEYQQS